jgi:hypothetical protein
LVRKISDGMMIAETGSANHLSISKSLGRSAGRVRAGSKLKVSAKVVVDEVHCSETNLISGGKNGHKVS